ncbi:two-component regulator propeller domain-containing protein [Limibacter armeniacum]|uniref:two-component regulator propeller domain-containing protein n=1 Tax=Limibacter armeniacum TaxID=466084 RepID=UPI002FE5A1C4
MNQHRYTKTRLVILLCFLSSISLGQNLKFRTLQVEDGLSNNSVNDFINDSTGALWIATWDGLNHFNGHEFKIYRHDENDSSSIPSNFIYGLDQDKDKRIWVKSSVNTISLLKEDHSFQNYTFHSPIETHGINNQGEMMVVIDKDTLVYGDQKFHPCGGYHFREDKTGKYKKLLLDHFPEATIRDVLLRKNGDIWFATLTDGLIIYSLEKGNMATPKFHQYLSDSFNPYSLRSNEIYNLHEDTFGNIWLGTKDGGISIVLNNSDEIHAIYAHPVANPNLPSETVRAVTQDHQNNLWLGYYNAGLLYKAPHNTMFQYMDSTIYKGNKDWKRIRSLFTDKFGNVWVGTYAGIMRITPQKHVTHFSTSEHKYLRSNRTYNFCETENALWIAGWDGISKFDYGTNSFVAFEGQEMLEGFHTRKILADKDTLWIATEKNGVIVFSSGKLDFIKKQHGILNDNAYDLWKDTQTGNLWIATRSGISIYHPEKGIQHNIQKKDGLPSELVYGLLEGNEEIWSSTTAGIVSIDKKSYAAKLYPWKQGWQGPEFAEGAHYKNNAGVLYFGGVDGINYFLPNRMHAAQNFPLLHLKKSTDWEQTLQHGKFSASVESVGFLEKPQNDIVYRLKPLQSDWQLLDKDGKIAFEHLPAGSYTLQVGNSQEIDHGNWQQVGFDVPASIWDSPAFWLFLAGSVSIVFLYWRNRQVRAVQAKLEAKVAERTATILQQKEKLEAKNKEISSQKGELLSLYQRHQDNELEVEQLKQYFMGQFRKPLSEFKEGFEQLRSRDNSLKIELNYLLDQIVNELDQWDSIERVNEPNNQLSEKMTVTSLPHLFEGLVKQVNTLLKKYSIELKEEIELSHEWVELPVQDCKELWLYTFKEIIKYLSSHTTINLKIRELDNNHLSINIQVSSTLFHDSFEEIWQFSPYLKKGKVIMEQLGGQLTYEMTSPEQVSIKLSLPFNTLDQSEGKGYFKHWKFFEFSESLNPDKPNVLLVGEKYELDHMLSLLEDDRFDVLVEENIEVIEQSIHHPNIDALIIHNGHANKRLVNLIKKVKTERKEIPVLYTYDRLDYSIHEKLLDLGVDLVIQLPANASLLTKQLSTLIKKSHQLVSHEKPVSLLINDDKPLSLSPNEKLVRDGIELINQHIDDADFKVNTLSDLLQISQIKCYRVFKDVLGKSPSDIIIELRLEKAEQLIKANKLNIAEVSYTCGFNDPRYFSKVFKKHFGQSPKNYQKGVKGR